MENAENKKKKHFETTTQKFSYSLVVNEYGLNMDVIWRCNFILKTRAHSSLPGNSPYSSTSSSYGFLPKFHGVHFVEVNFDPQIYIGKPEHVLEPSPSI